MRERKFKCFLAMAFGHDDTDAVYERFISPLEKEFPIRVIRVDRKEHNREIDTVIMEELKDADLVIADLTYARPSVYYEAGFAERTAPVIYTVRRDHLHAKSGDPDDVRVHFDLLMKNIIPRGSDRDQQFYKRLKARLRHVLKPLTRERSRELVRADEEAKFSALSSARKQQVIDGEVRAALTGLGYREAGDVFVARRGSKVTVLYLIVTQGIRPRRFAHQLRIGLFDVGAASAIADDGNLSRYKRRIRTVEHLILVCSWNKISIASLKNKLDHAASSPDGNALSFDPRGETLQWTTKKHRGGVETAVEWHSRLVVLDRVKSIADLHERAKEFSVGPVSSTHRRV